jgi:hypothetical protein
VELAGVHYTLTDAGSKNGTSLNDRKLIEGKRYRLSSEDVVTICGYRIVVNLSVPLRTPYSAEKTDILEREMVLISRGQDEIRAQMEIVEGPGAGTVLDLPPSRMEASIGTAEDCDLKVDEKKVGALRLLVIHTPAGWRVDEASLERAGRLVACPSRGRLHDGDDIVIGKTRIRLRDPVDRVLADLKTKREIDTLPCREAEEAPARTETAGKPDALAPQPPDHGEEAESGKKPAAREGSRASQRGKESSPYGAEYRIAAIAFGIIAFLVSLLILILIFF